MTTDPPADTHDPPSAVAGTVDATPRAVTTNRIYERVRNVYLTADLRSLAAGAHRAGAGAAPRSRRALAGAGHLVHERRHHPEPHDAVAPAVGPRVLAVLPGVVQVRGRDRLRHLPLRVHGAAGRLPHQAGADRGDDLHDQPSRPDAAVRQRRRRGAGPADDLDDVPSDGPLLLRRRGAGPPPRGGAGARAGRRRPGAARRERAGEELRLAGRAGGHRAARDHLLLQRRP